MSDTSSTTVLQWGRDLSIAESLFRQLELELGDKGFNGAAIFRSRNPHEAAAVLEASGRLQWGRDLSIAESLTADVKIDALIALQWGRDLSIAESRAALRG